MTLGGAYYGCGRGVAGFWQMVAIKLAGIWQRSGRPRKDRPKALNTKAQAKKKAT